MNDDLISRKAAIDASCTCHGGVHCNHYPCKDVQAIMDIPSADAVEVVRCKDCKFSHLTYSGECKDCDKWTDDDGYNYTLYLDGNFYCGYGERREDAEIH